MSDLKPCKHCGMKPDSSWGDDGYGFGVFYIQCENDDCLEQPGLSDPNRNEAEDLWNYEVSDEQ